jgi:hypothetical protein
MEIQGKHIRLLLNILLVGCIVWLGWGWIEKSIEWFNHGLPKEIAKFLGISGSAVGAIIFLAHQAILLTHRKKKPESEEDVKVEYDLRAASWNRTPTLEESMRELAERE